MPAFITKECYTTHGGRIEQCADFWQVDGRGIHLEGMTHYCPKCKVMSKALGSERGFIQINGKNPIVDGDLSTCGSRYMKISDLAIRERGSRSSHSRAMSISNSSEIKNNSLVDEKTNTTGQTLIFFRPNRNYKGEFGFDWLREDDSPVAPQVQGEPPYKDIILGSHKSGYTPKTPNPSAYEDLKTEYEKQSIADRSAPLNEYYTPYLNLFAEDVVERLNHEHQNRVAKENSPEEETLPFLMPPTTAELRLIANVQGQKPEKVELEFDGQFISINGNTQAFTLALDKAFTPDATNREVTTKLKIQCLKGNPFAQYIKVWAYISGDKKFAGQFKLLANAYNDVKQLNVFFGEVSTPNPLKPTETLKGGVKEEELKLFYKGLYQSLVILVIQKIAMDMSDDQHFTGAMGESAFVTSQYGLLKTVQRDNYLKALQNKFYSTLKESNIQNYYLLFFMGNKSEQANGFALRGKKIGIMFEGRDVMTLVHEGMHGLGLYHTHMDYLREGTNKYAKPVYELSNYPLFKYIYPYGLPEVTHPDFMHLEKATSNIMGYKSGQDSVRYDTWKWQWDILRGAVK